jgi:hypothetical protein
MPYSKVSTKIMNKVVKEFCNDFSQVLKATYILVSCHLLKNFNPTGQGCLRINGKKIISSYLGSRKSAAVIVKYNRPTLCEFYQCSKTAIELNNIARQLI